MKQLPDLNKPDVARAYLKGFSLQKPGEKPSPVTEYESVKEPGKFLKVDEMSDNWAILAAHQMFRNLDWRANDATIH